MDVTTKIRNWIKGVTSFYPLRGWLVLLGGILVHLSLGTLYTFGNLSPYIVSYIREKSHPDNLRLPTSMWIYACALSGEAGSMFVGGWLYGKIGPRWTTLLGSWIMSAGVLLSYFAIQVSFWLLLFTYGLMFGIGVGIAYIGPLSCAMKWMPRWKGVANGLVVAGFGFGALIFDQVQTAFINPDNKRTSDDSDENYFTSPDLLNRVPTVFLILGATYAVMQLVGSLLLTDPPEDYTTQLRRVSVVNGSVYEIEDVDNGSLGGRSAPSTLPVAGRGDDWTEGSREPSPSDTGSASSPDTLETRSRSPTPPEESVEDTNEESRLIPPQEEEKKRSPSPQPVTTEVGTFSKIVRRSLDKDGDRDFLESSGSSWTTNVITSLHPKQMLRKTNFYILWFMFMFNGIAIVFVATLYKVFALDFISNDHFLAVVGSTASIFNSLGRIMWGLLADRVSYKFALVVLSATMTVFNLTFYATCRGGEVMFFIWVCVIFSCIGGNFSLFPTAIGRSYGPKYVGLNYGLLFTSQIVSALLVSLVTTTLIDHVQWHGLMFFVSACSFTGFVLALFYRSKKYISLNFSGS